VVIQFLVDDIQPRSKAASFRRRWIRRWQPRGSRPRSERSNPWELPSGRTLLSRAAVKRGDRLTKKAAITRAELEAMLATCDESLEGLRDRALLCFGFASGGRRRSEIAAADMRDRRRVGDDGYIYYRLEYFKTQQAGVTADFQ